MYSNFIFSYFEKYSPIDWKFKFYSKWLEVLIAFVVAFPSAVCIGRLHKIYAVFAFYITLKKHWPIFRPISHVNLMNNLFLIKFEATETECSSYPMNISIAA